MNKKLKFSLLGTIITSSALAITLPMISCSSSQPIELPSIELKSFNLSNAHARVRNFMRLELKNLATFAERQELASKWKIGSNLSSNQKLEITNNVYFEDNEGNKYENDLVIDNIVFISETILYQKTDNRTFMNGTKIKINLKDGYFAPDDNLIIEFPEVWIDW
ncbi:MAG: hypothetical protein ACRCUM_00030 [Mycoplasmoidaceae bacterium]